MGNLREKQSLFMKLLPRLIDYIYQEGYEVTGGDLWSKPEYKVHKANSNHYIRLAIDLNLFKDGVFLTDTESHRKFGEYWESLLPGETIWGGRWRDGNHYSLKYKERM